jgi:hypothetical protein
MHRPSQSFRCRKGIACTVAGFVAASMSTIAPAQDFTAGDLYLLSQGLPGVLSGIVRVDPVTGGTSLLADLPEIPPLKGNLTYDPHRDRLVYLDTRNPGGIVAVDAAGNRTDLAPGETTPRVVAARGDGILYYCGVPSTIVRYLDAQDVAHDLLDEAGAAGFLFAAGSHAEELVYHPQTNSLVVITGQRNGVACANANRTCALRIPLTAGGTQVAGPVEFTEVDISPGGLPLVAKGSGLLPTGELLYVMDTNTNNAEPRMQRLDVAAMTSLTYASSGPYVGAAALDAGTFSGVRGQALILDSDTLRAFGQGESGSGTPVAGDVYGVGGVSRLVEIRAHPATGAEVADRGARIAGRLSVRPNPSRTGTSILCELPSPAAVRASIHDAAGRRVRDLDGGHPAAGVHGLHWDGRDERRAPVPSGVYFVRVTQAGASLTERIVILR